MNTYHPLSYLRSSLFISCLLFFQTLHAQSDYNALFIGNSLTYYNDLPGMIGSLAASGGNSLTHASHTPGGSSLTSLYRNAAAMDKITEEQWDFVILQGQSMEAIIGKNPNHYFMQFVSGLVHRITQNGSKAVYYMTFANNDVNNDYNQLQSIISGAYIYAGNMTHSIISPVGMAWQQSLTARPELVLHQADGVHPTVMGTYLAACVFYASLFCETPLGLWKPAGITEGEASHFQQIAHDLVFGQLRYWNMDDCADQWLNLPVDPVPPIQVSLFPNPASDEVQVSFPTDGVTPIQVNIFSQDGRLVKEGVFTGYEVVRISTVDLPSGLFFVTLKTGEKRNTN